MITQIFGVLLLVIIIICIISNIISFIPYSTYEGKQNKKLLDENSVQGKDRLKWKLLKKT